MGKRLYQEQDHCPVARTLNVLGDRWTLLIIRDMLAFRRNRFSELLDALPGLSPNLLSQRLKHLEDTGIVRRELYSEHPPRMEYRLTDKGKALGPVLASMRDWGDRFEPSEKAATR
jgi:DNA-binding HxlR family transcriptional regulator